MSIANVAAISFEQSQRARCVALARRSENFVKHGYFVRQTAPSVTTKIAKQTAACADRECRRALRPYLLIDAAKHCRIIAKNSKV